MKNVAVVEALWAGHAPKFVETFVRVIQELGHRPYVICTNANDARQRMNVPAYPIAVESLSHSPGGVRRALRTASLWAQIGKINKRHRLSLDLVLFSLVDHFCARFLSAETAHSLIDDVPYAGLVFAAPWLKSDHHRDAYGARDTTLKSAKVLATLDEEIVSALSNSTGAKVRFIPDGFESVTCFSPAKVTRPKIHIGVFGALGKRKRLLELARFIAKTELDDFCFSLVGRVSLSGYSSCEQRTILEAMAMPHVMARNEFVEELELDRCMSKVDLVWLVYDAHHGSSGIMARASRQGKAMLTADDTLLARRVERYELGASIDALDVSSIKSAVSRAMAQAKPSGIQRYAFEFSEQAAHTALKHFIEEALR